MLAQISVENSVQSQPQIPSGNQPTRVVASLSGITYEQLLQKYKEKNKFSRTGTPRTEQSLKNVRSVAQSWVRFNVLTLSSLIGDELGALFGERLAKYLDDLVASGMKGQTIRDRKSLLSSLYAIYHELVLDDGLPADPSDALDCLIRAAGVTNNQVSRNTGIGFSTIQDWRYKDFHPSPKSLTKIHKLEDYLKVPRGTLTARLPDSLWMPPGYKSCQTLWRRHHAKLIAIRYRLDTLPARLQEEWDDLYRFFTVPEWAEEHGLTNNVFWSIRPHNGLCGTSQVKHEIFRSFFGYLRLAPDNADPGLRGPGFNPDSFTIALFSDFEMVRDYLTFMKSRNVLQEFNRWSQTVLSFCTQLLRAETGYLWQRREFALRMLNPIPQDEWRGWCETNRAKLISFRKKINKNRIDGLEPTRDSFEPVRSIIENHQHPIMVLLDLARKLESLTPLVAKCYSSTHAIHVRDLFLIKLLASNPLRVENLSMMTYIPLCHSAFEVTCESYRKLRSYGRTPEAGSFFIETDRSSNLYQKHDGSWWLRFNPEDFKSLRPNGPRIPYDVPVVEWVWLTLMDYLFIHRASLNQCLKRSIIRSRMKHNIRSLTGEEALAIDRCAFVFRPCFVTDRKLCPKQFRKLQGVESMSNIQFTNRLLKLTQQYIPGCPGFGAHACRHLVASEYIKNHPDGWAVAAAALNDSVETVKRHYAWVRPADKIKPWNDYFEDLHRKLDK